MIPGTTGASPVVRDDSAARRPRPAQHRSITFLLLAAFVGLTSSLSAAEVIPPKPDRYFNDYARVIPSQTGAQFNEQLAQFERETSNQVLVAVYPKMQTDSDIADYTQRIAQSWGVGQKDRRNGAVLFVFVEDRKMFIQVGYGLEGVLPDITAFDITENRIKPRFRSNDYAGGLAIGIDSITKAIRGEYKGTGRTVKERGAHDSAGSPAFILFFFIFIIALIILGRIGQKRGRRGYRYSSLGGPFIGGWSGGSGGGWSSGGGGGFSGFSGGGGSFGGGGAGSSW
jgi:uncharacterized protein